MLVGENGSGDDFGIGDEKAYSILEVAQLFGGEIVMKPASPGNRTGSDIDISKIRSLGWSSKKKLADYITQVKKNETSSYILARVLSACWRS